MNLLKIDNLYWICTQNHKFDHFSVNMHMYKKLRNFWTIHPGAVSLVLKYAQNLNKNCHENFAARALHVLEISREKLRGG